MPRIASITAQALTGLGRTFVAPVSLDPVYVSFVLDLDSYNETDLVGNTNVITATVTTVNVAEGTTVGYTVTGLSASDLEPGSTLTGTIAIDAKGQGVLQLFIRADELTEGPDQFTITLAATDSAGNATGSLSDSAVINDTSFDPNATLWLDSNDEPATVRVIIGANSMQITGFFATGTPVLPITIQGRQSAAETTITAVTARTATFIEVDDTGNSTSFIVGEQLNLIAPSIAAPSLGDEYEGGYYIGDTSVSGQSYRLVVAPADTEIQAQLKTTATLTSGTTSVSDGFANTESMNNADHPAAQYVRSLTTGGFTDWYLPAYNEYVFVILPNHNSLPLAQQFGNRFYWGSFTDSADQGRIFNPVTGSAGNTTKTNSSIWVRAIRRVAI